VDPHHTLLKPQHELSTLLLSGGFESKEDGTQDIPQRSARGLVTDSPQIDQTRSQSEASPLAATANNSNFLRSFTESDSMGWSPQGIDYPSSAVCGSTEALPWSLSPDGTPSATASTSTPLSCALAGSEILSERSLSPLSHGIYSSKPPKTFRPQANIESKCQSCSRVFKDQEKLSFPRCFRWRLN
jgi:hypothetical protein